MRGCYDFGSTDAIGNVSTAMPLPFRSLRMWTIAISATEQPDAFGPRIAQACSQWEAAVITFRQPTQRDPVLTSDVSTGLASPGPTRSDITRPFDGVGRRSPGRGVWGIED